MRPLLSHLLVGSCVLLLGAPAFAQASDIEQLHELVRQTRTELQMLRQEAGLARERRGEHGEHGEGRGEHGGRGEGRGEHGGRGEHRGHGEGRGEHGGLGEGGEESGQRLGKHETENAIRNGARLILAYDPRARSFRGSVENTTERTLSEVRVEVHLSNGVELGPTMRTDLAPGQKISVELSAADQEFEWWTTHPEHGSEEGHGAEHGGEHHEHGGREGADNRPRNRDLRPLYNELLLLRREVQTLREDLRSRRGERRR